MPQITKEPVFVSDSIKVVRLGVPAGTAVPEHHSNVDVIATIVRGEGSFTVEGQSRAVHAGDVVTMSPRARHAITADTDLEIVVVHARVAPTGEPPACGA
jgi:quercetin dioxygenase-like cupin family protein